jgi:hypothetical protein
MLYYVTHKDQYGERHQIGDSFDALSAADAIRMILEGAQAEDDGQYEAWPVGK